MNSLSNYVETFKYNANILENVKDMIEAIQMPMDTDIYLSFGLKVLLLIVNNGLLI